MKSFEQFFDRYFRNSVPCSFSYDGKPARFGPLCDAGEDPSRKHYVRLMETDRFRAALHVDVLYDAAVEWWLELSAPTDYDSDVVSDLYYCDFGLERPFIETATGARYPALHWAKGSRASETDFQPQVENLWPFSDDTLRFQCDFGRSSSGCMPYFNLQTEEEKGVIFAIGWTGQWYFSVHRRDTDYKISTIELKAEMDRARFRVYSGEVLLLPGMLAMLWDGTGLEGSYNLFRRLIYKDMPKRNNGASVNMPISFLAWGGRNAAYHKDAIKTIKDQHFGGDQCYWIDAGWYGAGDETSEAHYRDTWYFNVGEWNALPSLYPNGMEEVGNAAADAGMDFLLWFELERCVSRHEIVKKHREYFLGAKLPFTEDDFYEGARTRYSLMLNLGNDEARKYITQVLAEHIEKCRIRCLRIDFNHEPLFHWRYGDSEDRWGITEIKYINGFYTMIDELRERFPYLMVDNCASGGRRLDFQMMRRSVPLSFTDYLCTPDRRDEAMQAENYAVTQWVPVHGEFISRTDDYGFRSHLCSAVCIHMGPGVEQLAQRRDWYARMIEQSRRAQPILEKDHYLLTSLNADTREWFAYEVYDEESGKGLILAFRRENCMNSSITVKLHGLHPEGSYVFENADTQEKQAMTAGRLEDGFVIELPEKRSSALIFFEQERK